MRTELMTGQRLKQRFDSFVKRQSALAYSSQKQMHENKIIIDYDKFSLGFYVAVPRKPFIEDLGIRYPHIYCLWGLVVEYGRVSENPNSAFIY